MAIKISGVDVNTTKLNAIDAVVDTNQDFLDGTTATPATYRRELGRQQTSKTTIDLNQAAGSYDLFTGTTADVILTGFSIRLPNVDVSDDASLTSISIQTDDATVTTLLSSADGAVANLTAESQHSYSGIVYIDAGTKIQLTIAGGASDATTTCQVGAIYTALNDGGYLA